jgi:phosphoglycolate phosphatase
VLGISSYFVQIWGGDTIGVKKPNPKTILDLVKLTNSDISQTVMIGDSVNDFLVAKASGVLSIAVSYGYSNVECFKKYAPNYIVKTAKDIIDIVL